MISGLFLVWECAVVRKDFFICHASPEKESVAVPLALALEERGYSSWIDKAEILWGDRLSAKIQEGLSGASYVIVVLSEAFLDPSRKWPDRELDAALGLEIHGYSVVLVVVVGDEQKLLRPYPFLQAKRYKRWDEGIDAILAEVESLRGRDQKLYTNAIGGIEALPVSEAIQIDTISYGEGPQAVTNRGNLLQLPSDTIVPRRYVPFDGREGYIVRDLLPPDWMDRFSGLGLFVPHTYTVSGIRQDPNNTIALYRVNDQIYLVGHDRSNGERSFSITAAQGRGGIASFITANGELQNDNPYCLGNGLGGVRLLTAVEFSQGVPVARSPFVLCIRKGIRDPDDIWRSSLTGTAIVPPGTTDFSTARFLFQSHQPNGMSSDLFVADFCGTRLRNLTKKHETSYDGLFDENGKEIGRWLNATTIQYCSQRSGKRETVTKNVPNGVIEGLQRLLS